LTRETCGAVGERAPSVGNASHPQKLGVMKARPSIVHSFWRADSRMLKTQGVTIGILETT
jgi:hypothetical protein